MRIPTAVTLAESELLGRLAERQHVYEAGALLGYSTLVMAKTADLVLSVDPHDGYPVDRPRPTWDLFLRNIRGIQNIVPIRARFQDVPPLFGTGFAFADLTGEESLTWEFLMHTHEIPVVGVHDYGRTGCDGVARAVDRYVTEYMFGPSSITRVDTLVVLRKRRM